MHLAPDHLADLRRSGISDETIEAAKIYSVPPGDIAKKVGFNSNWVRSLLAFPYPGTDGFERYRVIPSVAGKPRYLQRKGTPSHLYVPPGMEKFFAEPAEPLFIVEGEKKALRGFQEGLPCIGLAGLWCWSNGRGGLITDFNKIELNGRTVYLVPDSDWRTPSRHGYRTNLEKAVYGLSQRLFEREARVSVVELPPGKGGEKVGIDDYLCQHTVAEFKELPVEEMTKMGHGRESQREPAILSFLESWNYIRSLEIKVEWLIDRLIPKESLTVIFGKGGIGKTWLALDIARCVGSGLPFLGLASTRSPVVYIDFENPLAVLNSRIRKIGDSADVVFWRANNEKLKAPKLDSKEWLRYKDLPPGALCIFDTLRASQGRDENASDEMGLIMGRLKELRDLGFTILLLHHTAKNSDRVAKGSTAIVDLADHILGLTLVRKKKDGQEEIIEDESLDEDIVYRFGTREKTRFDEPYHIYLTLNPDKGFELAPDPQEETLKSMHYILAQNGSMTKTAFLNACKVLSIGDHKLRRLFDTGGGRYWKVSPDKGRKNSIYVTPIQFDSFSPYIYTRKTDKLESDCSVQLQKHTPTKNHQSTLNIQFDSLSKGYLKTDKLESAKEVMDLTDFEVVAE